MSINVTINASFIAILIVNVKDVKMTDVKVQVYIFNCATFSNDPSLPATGVCFSSTVQMFNSMLLNRALAVVEILMLPK